MRGNPFVITLINILFGIVQSVLILRLILKVLSANPNTPFVGWTYRSSEPLLNPFKGIFPSPLFDRGSVLEFSTIFAIAIYSVLAFFLTQLVSLMLHGSWNAGAYEDSEVAPSETKKKKIKRSKT